MFEIRSNFFSSGYLDYPVVSNHALLLNQAINLFNKARRSRLFGIIKAALLGRATTLINLSLLPQNRVLNKFHGGIHPIHLDQVIGTLGRVGDFDNRFHPLSDRIRGRWVSVAIARNQYIPLEPVKLIQVGEHYFVEDGHHRISVARARGESVMDAEITIWKVSGSLPWETKTASAVHPVLKHLSI